MLRGSRQLVITDLLRGSRARRACRQLVTRKLVIFRPSRHVKMVWRVANFLVTSRQLVGRVGRVEFGERHDKRTNQQRTARRPIM